MARSLIEDGWLFCPWCGMTRKLAKRAGLMQEHCEDHMKNGDEKQYHGFVEAWDREKLRRGT